MSEVKSASSNKESSTNSECSGVKSSKSNDGGGSESKQKSKAPSEIKSKAGSEIKSKAGSQVSSKVSSQAKSKTGSQVKSKSGLEEKSKSKAGSEVKSKAGSEVKSKAGSEVKSKAGSEVKSKAGSEVKSKAGSEVKSKAGSEVKSKAGSEVKSKAGSEVKSKAGSEVKSKASSEAKSKAGSEAKLKSGSESKSKSVGSQVSGKAKSKTGSQSKSKSGLEAKSKTGSEVKSKAGSEVKSKAGLDNKSASAISKSKSKAGSEAKSKTGIEAKSKTGSQAKSKAGSEEKLQSKVSSIVKTKSGSESKSKLKEPGSGPPKSSVSKKSSKEKPSSSDFQKGQSVLSNDSANKETIKLDKMHLKSGFKPDLFVLRIGFIGAGKMTEAIVRGLLNNAKVSHKKIFVAAKTNRNLELFNSKYGIMTTTRLYDIFGQLNCEIIFFCVHGFVIKACYKNGGLRPMALATNYIPNLKHPLYFLSLIGGVSLDEIKQTILDPDNPEKYMIEMHRLVLNTCVATGFGLGVIDVDIDSKNLSPIIKELLLTITKFIFCEPVQFMDALCTLTGSGLAFIYFFINAMSEGGLKMGLNKNMAIKLVAKAMQSAANSILESDKHPSELRDSVLSRGGPAIYGIDVLNKNNCDSGFQNAIEASYRRLKELVNIEPIEEVEARPTL